MSNNNTNFMSWLWETTNGTAIITAADTQTYLFGAYNEDVRVTPPSPNQQTSEVFTHQYRNPILLDRAVNLPTWKHQFHPVNAIPEMMFLGTGTDADPDTITMKHTGLKHSFSARWEYKGGTNPRRVQSVGNYAIGYYSRVGIDMAAMVEITNAWQKFESESDRVALTTSPEYPEDIEEPYYGLSEVKWDYGEAGEAEWNEVFEIEFSQMQNYSISNPTKQTQLIYPLSYKPVEITFHAVLNQNEQWEDYVAREQKDVAIKIPKPNDSTKYKQFVFKDVKIERVVDTHIAYDGKTLSLIQARCPYFDVNFTHEGSNFATYYPAYS